MIVNIKDLIRLNCRERAAELVASMYMHDESAINGKAQHVDTHILKETTKSNPFFVLAQEDTLTQEEFSRDCEYSKKTHVETSKDILDAMVLEYIKKGDRFRHDLSLYYKGIVNKQSYNELTGRLRVVHELDNQDMYVQVYRDGQASTREKACGVTIIFDIDAAGRAFIFTAFPNVDRESCVNSTTIGWQSGYIKGCDKKIAGADCPANLEAFEATADGSPTKNVTYSLDHGGNYYIKSSNIARAAGYNRAQEKVEMKPCYMPHGESAKRVVTKAKDTLHYALNELGKEKLYNHASLLWQGPRKPDQDSGKWETIEETVSRSKRFKPHR